MTKIVFSILYVASCLLAPWWFSVALGIILIAYLNLWVVAILGGLLIDLAFGAPIAAFGGFEYLYTALFIVLSSLAFVLKNRMLE